MVTTISCITPSYKIKSIQKAKYLPAFEYSYCIYYWIWIDMFTIVNFWMCSNQIIAKPVGFAWVGSCERSLYCCQLWLQSALTFYTWYQWKNSYFRQDDPTSKLALLHDIIQTSRSLPRLKSGTMHICISPCIHIIWLYIYVYVTPMPYTYTYTHIYRNIHTYIHMCVRVYVCRLCTTHIHSRTYIVQTCINRTLINMHNFLKGMSLEIG